MSKKIIKHGTEEFEISYFYTEITNRNVAQALQNDTVFFGSSL